MSRTTTASLGIVGVLFGAGFGGLWLVLLGWFLTAAARSEETQLEVRERSSTWSSPTS